MKKYLLLICSFVLSSTFIFAQDFGLGIKAGANMGKISGQSFKEGFNLSYHVGAFAHYDFNEKLGIQPELLYSQTQTRTATGETSVDNLKPDFKAKLNYMYIPVLLRYNVNNLLTLHAGPQFGILINENASTTQNAKSAFKSGDLSGVLGAQVNLRNFIVYGRYNIGLQNIKDVSHQGKWTSQTLQLGLGYRIL